MIKNVIFDVGRVLAAYDYQSYLNRKNYSEEEQQIIKKAMFESQTWLWQIAARYRKENSWNCL